MHQLLPRATFEGRYVLSPGSLSGLGDGISTGQAISTGASTVTAAGSLARASTGTQYMAGAGATILAAAPFTGPAAPFVAAAGAVVSLLAALGVGSGCGPTCVLSSRYANKAEEALTLNISTYFSLPTPRSSIAQDAALRIFDAVWADLRQQCGNEELGDAGRRCITDRQSGSCKWKQTADSPLLQYPGEPQPGECWNWFSGYRDPIANDPHVIAETSVSPTNPLSQADMSVAGSLNQITAQMGGVSPLLLIGGALLLVGIFGGKKS